MKRPRRGGLWVKTACLALGVWLLWRTIASVGISQILEGLSGHGWEWIPLFSVYALVYAFGALGWAYAFPRAIPRIPFREFYVVRIVGETLNAVIPGSLGGEPIKAALLKQRHGIALSETYASILIVHTTYWVSLNLFVLCALGATFRSQPLTGALRDGVTVFLVVLGVVAALLVAGLHFGVFQKIHAVGDFFKLWGARSSEKAARYLELDAHIRSFYTREKGRFVLSTLWNFLQWSAGVLETWWIGLMLGLDIGWVDAWLFEALFSVLRIATFFIPGSLGAQEGGIVFLLTQFGYGRPEALAFALVRRIREIGWLAAGLALWAFLKESAAPKFSGSASPRPEAHP